MFSHSKRYELHLHAREVFQRWPLSDMTCLKETLITLCSGSTHVNVKTLNSKAHHTGIIWGLKLKVSGHITEYTLH